MSCLSLANMRDLLRGTIERLAGKSSNAVFHLKQAMGGGNQIDVVGIALPDRLQQPRHQFHQATSLLELLVYRSWTTICTRCLEQWLSRDERPEDARSLSRDT